MHTKNVCVPYEGKHMENSITLFLLFVLIIKLLENSLAMT